MIHRLIIGVKKYYQIYQYQLAIILQLKASKQFLNDFYKKQNEVEYIFL